MDVLDASLEVGACSGISPYLYVIRSCQKIGVVVVWRGGVAHTSALPAHSEFEANEIADKYAKLRQKLAQTINILQMQYVKTRGLSEDS